jgi:hypothetical protein
MWASCELANACSVVMEQINLHSQKEALVAVLILSTRALDEVLVDQG